MLPDLSKLMEPLCPADSPPDRGFTEMGATEFVGPAVANIPMGAMESLNVGAATVVLDTSSLLSGLDTLVDMFVISTHSW